MLSAALAVMVDRKEIKWTIYSLLWGWAHRGRGWEVGKAAGSGNRMLKCNFLSDLSPKMCLLDLHFVAFIYTDDPVETWCIVPQKELL